MQGKTHDRTANLGLDLAAPQTDKIAQIVRLISTVVVTVIILFLTPDTDNSWILIWLGSISPEKSIQSGDVPHC